jgi:hypothetical protein
MAKMILYVFMVRLNGIDYSPWRCTVSNENYIQFWISHFEFATEYAVKDIQSASIALRLCFEFLDFVFKDMKNKKSMLGEEYDLNNLIG